MPVIEPNVTYQKLIQLLAEGGESETLDYKETLDLRERRDVVELAKDVGAMQVDGAFIVVGADSRGRATGRMTSHEAGLLDEAELRRKLSRYIPEPYEIRSAVHDHDGTTMGLIYIAPNPKGLCIFKADGQYEDPPGRAQTVFRKGEVFVRHGSASERWEQHDIDRIVSRIRGAEKERWRAEVFAEVTHAVQAAGAEGPTTALPLTWRADEQSFESALTSALQSENDIGIRLLFEEIARDAADIVDKGDIEGLETLLDRLACLASLAIQLDLYDLLDRAVHGLVRAYELGFDAHGNTRVGLNFSASRLWLGVMYRVIARSGLEMRRRDWQAVRTLVLQHPGGVHFRTGFYTNWVRHAHVEASRAGHLEMPLSTGQLAKTSLLNIVNMEISRLACLRRDLPAGDDRLLTSMTQFDALAALTVLAHAPGDRDFSYYPSYGYYEPDRYEGAITSVIDDPDTRRVIFPLDDDALADSLRLLEKWVRAEGTPYGGGYPYIDPAIRRFLDEHPPH